MITVPLYLLAAVLFTAVLPVLLLVGLVVDLAGRRRLATVRAVTMVEVYLLCEAGGIFASLWISLRHRDRRAFLDANWRLEFWWAGALYRAGVRLFSLDVRVEGADAAQRTPLVLFSRHVSVIDNLLPVAFVSLPYGSRLRWVINRSLLRDPCIDIVGHRLPNAFVSNGRDDSESEIRRVGQLGAGLGEGEGVLIFPEGALFSPARRERVIARLESAGDAGAAGRARALANVLPPRLGGSLALLESAQGVDAVFLAHRGLEDSTSYRAILGGGLIGRRIDVAFWRVPASEIPTTPEGRADWLYRQWAKLDAWVTRHAGDEEEVSGA